MKLTKTVGLLSYGVSLPQTMIKAEEIARSQGKDEQHARSLGVRQKTVAAIDEDTITLATEAGFSCLDSWRKTYPKDAHSNDIQALFIGSESHPYAVKPSGTVVKTALGMNEQIALADLQFACKAGTQSLQIVMSYALSGMAKCGLAIGADTAQSRPGDILEFTAGAGAAAFLVGCQEDQVIAQCLGTLSVATDTPDFWRRPGQPYPEHAGRFSGDPGYFAHIKMSVSALLSELKLQPSDFAYCVFHTPNAKFPQTVAKQLGFTAEQLQPSLVVKEIGNTYAAASMLAFAAVLDEAKPHQKILLASYGSGSGSDVFVFETTSVLSKYRKHKNETVKELIGSLQPISYHEYQHANVGKL
jgi:hydroxymethylglutaryl-CoA synthase